MTTTRHLDSPGDYVVRRRIGPITSEEILAYAHATNDFNPIHTDREFALRCGLPDVVAHGPLLAGVLACEISERYDPFTLRELRLTFLSPVVVGDELRFSARVDDFEASMPEASERLLCHVSITARDGAVRAEGTMSLTPPSPWRG